LEVNELAGYIEKSARNALEMIDDLLQLVRQGSTISELKEEDSRAVIREALQGLTAILEHSKAEVRLDGDFPPVQCDRRRLVQVFSNLIGNAVKYVAPGTTPSVVVRGIDTSFATIFCVVDNGIGIPAADRKRIFQPFVRLRGETYDGTGIGLSIVRRIVHAHGGAVFVQSPREGGTEFFVMLPRTE
jgi:signal transduction histidine kinase